MQHSSDEFDKLNARIDQLEKEKLFAEKNLNVMDAKLKKADEVKDSLEKQNEKI